MKSRSAMTSIVGYIPQFDLFVGTLTVKEHLTFLANLRLGKTVPKAEREEKIEHLMKQVSRLLKKI